MSNPNPTYDINNYTETELYNILELVNPSDRELEAKILYYIRKYENNPAAAELHQFFEDIYGYFFQASDSDETESESDEPPTQEGFTPAVSGATTTTTTDTKKNDDAAAAAAAAAPVVYTKELDYNKDPLKLNPILKQTVSTLVTIDSSYREDKYLSSTNFSFNLSRPLRDVISLKLYAVQIPYTWWTINKNYGGNFFYLKGNVSGILTDGGTHDIKIEIDAGNYTGSSLTTAINAAITALDTTYTDVSFGNSYLDYNAANAVATLYLDIQRQFRECDYTIYFPPQTSTLSHYSLYEFLGFTNNTYDFNSLYSNTKTTTTTAANQNIYTIDDNNNTIYIKQYRQSTTDDNPYAIYDASTSTVVATYSITLTNGTYSENTIYSLLNTELSANSFMTSASALTKETDASGNYQYVLAVELDRYTTTTNSAATKLAVVLPAETSYYPVWSTYNNSAALSCCFSFPALVNEINQIVSENEPKATSYIVYDNLSFYIECTTDQFVDTSNNYYFDVSSSLSNSDGEYVIEEYLAAINAAIAATNETTVDDYNPNGIINMTNTAAYLDTDTQTIRFNLDINKIFSNSSFELDLSNSIFARRFYFDQYTTDLTTDLTAQSRTSSTYEITSTNNTFYIYGKSDVGLSSFTKYEVVFPTGIYTGISSFVSMVNSTFASFQDDYGENVLNSSTLSYSLNPAQYNNLTLTLALRIKKVLTETDYRIVFYDDDTIYTDASVNYWLSDLKMYSYYDLSGFQTTETNDVVYSTISGFTNIDVVNFTIDSSSETFTFYPQTAGITSSDGGNNITFTLSQGTYSQDQIYAAINAAFAANSLTASQSVIYKNSDGYTVLRPYVDKCFRAADYRLVLYDVYSFRQCESAATNTINASWDNTLGWMMGFQSAQEYALDETAAQDYTSTNTYSNTDNVVSIQGDTVLNVNRINYLMIILKDYTQSQLNNTVVTVAGGENTAALPSYATYYSLCSTGALTQNPITHNYLTQKQIYAIQQTEASNEELRNNQYTYTTGANSTDVFASIPLKLSGMSSGQVFVENSGFLQNQTREYFGQVNIQRMTVSLIDNTGDVVDLNGANWSFTFIAEQLYTANVARPGKKMS